LGNKAASRGGGQHHIDGRLALFLANFAKRLSNVFLQLRLVVYTLDDKTVNGAADTGLNSPELAIGLLSFTIDGRFLASLSFGG